MRSEAGREVGIEGVSLVAEDRSREDRCRPDVPGQLQQAPAMPGAELMTSGHLAPGRSVLTLAWQPVFTLLSSLAEATTRFFLLPRDRWKGIRTAMRKLVESTHVSLGGEICLAAGLGVPLSG